MNRIAFYEMISKTICLQTILFDNKAFFNKKTNVKMHEVESNFMEK